ncbi:Ornithine decarboxylase [Hypoxylon texense]
MDPFSVATGAAGLVSLGLTVSGGLIQYCRDYQSRDADLAQLSQRAQELESFLTLIEKRTTGPQGPDGDIHTALQGCRDVSDACLQDFKRLNDKYANSNFGRGRKLVHNLKYPFNKGKFEDIRSRLREFNVALLGHLHDITRGLRVQMVSESDRVATAVDIVGRQLQSSISNAERAIGGTIRDKTDQLGLSFQQGIQKTEDHVTTSVAIGLHSLSESIGKGQEQQTSIVMRRLDQVVQMLQSQNRDTIFGGVCGRHYLRLLDGTV